MTTFKLANFRIIGIFLMIGLFFCITYKIFLLPSYDQPKIMSIGNGFEGNLQLPIEVVRARIDAAKDVMLNKADIGRYLQWVGEITTWLSFLATAIITLIIGASGRTPPVNPIQLTQDEIQGFSTKTVRIIGVLAALSAIFTATSNMSVSQSQIYMKQAETFRVAISTARVEVMDAMKKKGQEDIKGAEDALDKLDLIIRQ